MDVTIGQASTSSTVHINGAHEVHCGDVSTSGVVELVGDNLEDVSIGNLSTDATLFASYTDDDSDTEMTIENIAVGGAVTMMNCDDVEVYNAFRASLTTDNSRNCDQVSSWLGGGPYAGLSCTVDDGLMAPETPGFPEEVVYDVDLSSKNYDCNDDDDD